MRSQTESKQVKPIGDCKLPDNTVYLTHLTALPDGRFLAVNYPNDNLYVVDKDGKHSTPIPHKHDNILGIAIGNNEIILRELKHDNEWVYVYDQDALLSVPDKEIKLEDGETEDKAEAKKEPKCHFQIPALRSPTGESARIEWIKPSSSRDEKEFVVCASHMPSGYSINRNYFYVICNKEGEIVRRVSFSSSNELEEKPEENVQPAPVIPPRNIFSSILASMKRLGTRVAAWFSKTGRAIMNWLRSENADKGDRIPIDIPECDRRLVFFTGEPFCVDGSVPDSYIIPAYTIWQVTRAEWPRLVYFFMLPNGLFFTLHHDHDNSFSLKCWDLTRPFNRSNGYEVNHLLLFHEPLNITFQHPQPRYSPGLHIKMHVSLDGRLAISFGGAIKMFDVPAVRQKNVALLGPLIMNAGERGIARDTSGLILDYLFSGVHLIPATASGEQKETPQASPPSIASLSVLKVPPSSARAPAIPTSAATPLLSDRRWSE